MDFDSRGNILSKEFNAVNHGVTDEVTGQVKVIIFDFLSCLVLLRITTVSNRNLSFW